MELCLVLGCCNATSRTGVLKDGQDSPRNVSKNRMCPNVSPGPASVETSPPSTCNLLTQLQNSWKYLNYKKKKNYTSSAWVLAGAFPGGPGQILGATADGK